MAGGAVRVDTLTACRSEPCGKGPHTMDDRDGNRAGSMLYPPHPVDLTRESMEETDANIRCEDPPCRVAVG